MEDFLIFLVEAIVVMVVVILVFDETDKLVTKWVPPKHNYVKMMLLAISLIATVFWAGYETAQVFPL
ncbi:MAG: hypothetical protein CO183_01015 [Candidatus Zambryskibacteria bacterium CG_4_9_14_3_um_filter_42_9]|uniref:Uncharacterized protein n=1 Tax=Candidatus Zambryskibacteria bacterium CG22_combo_CG10-13_8_21_14_all_42_17 TaxID=1975118 RepID=A0A2H0BDE3_9BACT|nr:MAG: hypothetical protein COX06_02200 [Candidatus Zambryskibacteria bacterium CG22_combo_CG10-13_8_21_14_all_42_17]PJA36915.1 MAG: hypothetical protein CO183_01015 [Candidatus Zambryskibacteria bacterium CG_4_9_14_3_um_filter_42_9]